MKRHRITEWVRKHDPHIYCLKETDQDKRPNQSEREGLETNFPSKGTGKKKQGQ